MTILDNLSVFQKSELLDALGRRGGILAFAQKYGLNADSLRGALSRAGGSDALQPETLEADATPAHQAHDTLRSISQSCPKPLKLIEPVQELHLTKWLYCADVHAPMHDNMWIERLCRVAYHLAVSDLVIGGDFFDFAELSSHGSDIEVPDINRALELSGEVLRYIKSHFERVFMLPGNHCRRLAKRLDKNLSFRNLVKMAVGDMTGIFTTDDDYFFINGTWTVGHPRFFAQFPAKGLEMVAVQRQRNVIGAHSHTLGLIRHGQFLCASPGHLMRSDLVPYVQRSDGMSKFADQDASQGFVLVEHTKADGDVVTLFGQNLTRWSDFE